MDHNFYWLRDNSNITTVATLGPKSSSSEAAANYYANLLKRPLKILLFDTFEKASDFVENNDNVVLLVANAYKKADYFYMNPRTLLSGSFFFSPPKYYLCCKNLYELQQKINNNDIITIDTHHAPISRLDDLIKTANPSVIDLSTANLHIKLSTSTSQSAIHVAKGTSDCCLVNSDSIKLHRLEKISAPLTIQMTWVLFIKNKQRQKEEV
ncbi:MULTISPECIES: hypothetical protein [Aliivibrio]|nr:MULTISPECIES: hypothetical protein [Aliivibrio]MDD9173602.1 hypothetical protein [Aliivibrio sp. S3TY1]MDD9179858.1 hypothetical protein [Aliivibrio sp. A6]MDD9190678.1 hypothetical protein [Aliivibrio sp. S2TY2]